MLLKREIASHDAVGAPHPWGTSEADGSLKGNEGSVTHGFQQRLGVFMVPKRRVRRISFEHSEPLLALSFRLNVHPFSG